MTTDQQLFCDSLIDDLADYIAGEFGGFYEGSEEHAKIKEIVERRIEAHDAESLADWKRDIKRSFDGFVERL